MTLVMKTMEYEAEDRPYFYLAGPMSGMQDHNFPEFRRVAAKLREAGMTIVTPYDLANQPIPTGEAAIAAVAPNTETYKELLRRDVNIVMDPECRGIILLDGWENSIGARVETFVGEAWGRDLYAYDETSTGNPMLVYITRTEAVECLT